MGKIYDTFVVQNYINEDEVAHKFITPFLKEFLGYRLKNLIFKKRYKQRDNFKFKELNLNRSKKIKLENLKAEPDIIVASDVDFRKIFYKKYKDKKYNDKALFIVEAKGPGEKLEHHLEQKNVYCMAVHTNLCVMTNGTQFYIFDFNELLLACENLEELDLNFPLIKLLLHKDYQFEPFLLKISQFANRVKLHKPKNTNYSDFWEYIENNLDYREELETLGENIKKIKNYNLFKFTLGNNQPITYSEFFEKIKNMGVDFNHFEDKSKNNSQNQENQRKIPIYPQPIVVQGDSGVGKTYFLEHLKYIFIKKLYDNQFEKIPLLLKLKYWETKPDLLKFILDKINIEFLHKSDIRKYLKKGDILLFLDGYDEILQQDHKVRFLKELNFFRDQYPNTSIIITVRKGMYAQELIDNFTTRKSQLNQVIQDDLHNLVTLEPPKIEDLKTHVQVNLNGNPEQFFTQLQDKNLLEFARIPLFLNYLIIYYKRFSNFPSSLFKILDRLIQFYFEDHIKKKYLKIEPDLLKTPTKILSKIAFTMIYEKKVLGLNRQEFYLPKTRFGVLVQRC